MKNEADPISEEEYLLRRVHEDRFKNDRNSTHSQGAFEPRTTGRDQDKEGISLYREDCLNDPSQVLETMAPEKRGKSGVVRVPVSALKAMGLSVVPSKDERVPGHVVIPELNSIEYAAKKAEFTPVLKELAQIASLDDNICLRPGHRDDDMP